jgi:hypothetical protein
MIKSCLSHHDAVNTLSNKLQLNHIFAPQNSGAISTLDSDDLFNGIMSTYEAIVYTPSILSLTEELKIKCY